MKKITRLVSVGLFSIIIMFCSSMPVFAGEYRITAYISGPTVASHTLYLDKLCHFYGYASCEEGNMYGNHCTWVARQYGELAMTATNTHASFGSDESETNILPKSPMVTGGSILNSYERTAEMFTYYKKANTVLYY